MDDIPQKIPLTDQECALFKCRFGLLWTVKVSFLFADRWLEKTIKHSAILQDTDTNSVRCCP